jgi:hypothetical protein
MRALTCLVILLLAGPVGAEPINVVIGDASWHAGSPERADEVTRIRTHLTFMRERLARVTGSPQRQALLAALDRYIARGEFPRRTGDPYPGRRPRFIDDRGVHCAVGYLIEQSGREDLARAIDAEYEYAFVRDMHSPELAAWAAEHGFTIDELAMIQPEYAAPPTAERTRAGLEQMKDTITLRCAQQHAATDHVALHVLGDKDGRTIVTTRSTDPFERCFANAASGPGGEAWASRPQPYAFSITLQLSSPQKLFEQRLARLSYSQCTPRPGVIPARVVLDASPDAVHAVTSPSNAEIDRCLEKEVRLALIDFRGIAKLAAHVEIPLPSKLEPTYVRNAIAANAPNWATDCYPASDPPANVQLDVSAKVDDFDFTVRVDSPNAGFATCLQDMLQRRLRSLFAVSREMPNGTFERYFRIDADVHATVTVPVESPASRNARVKKTLEDAQRPDY